ncbi:TlpA disulfide reductase family protein [Bradyrhizobium sp. ARR65]|uniref:TlpA disulfide reductase family protein n=1 Tax=Bradyrhizobium sp. ARR65 TaxID=1040989 RepID=UPI000AB39E66|nr:TlpA disulfide reductase family protein [Bradyrhizobium sp. ARR65]
MIPSPTPKSAQGTRIWSRRLYAVVFLAILIALMPQRLGVGLEANMVLDIGSPAPPIKVEKWLRGQPLKNFQTGKTYVVEFWATWCAPCLRALPELVQLQEKYRDLGLEVVGVLAAEAATGGDVRNRVDAWLTKNVPNLNYRIAFDSTGEMEKLWMDASLSPGIPTSFVVDRDGRIAFIGHPSVLDDVLSKIFDVWHTRYEPKAADPAEGERVTHELIFAEPPPVLEAADLAAVLSVVEEAVALRPDDVNLRALQADLLLHTIRDFQAGVLVMHRLARDAIERNSEIWMASAMGQLFDPAKDNSQFPVADRFAIGKELSEHILALDPPQREDGPKFLSYAAVAQYYYESGNVDRAIELVGRALKSLDGPETIPAELKEQIQSQLLKSLTNYFCDIPPSKAIGSLEVRSPYEQR